MTVVTDHLERLGVRFEVLPHRRSTTALEEAQCLGMGADEVLKGIVLVIETGYALAIIPASCRLDLPRVRDALEDPSAELATEAAIEAAFPEFELGAIPALPSLLHVPVVIDPSVFAHRTVTFAGGVQRESVRLEPGALRHGATVTVAPIATPTTPRELAATGDG